MGSRHSVVLAFCAALAGGVAAIGIGSGAGWIDSGPATAPAMTSATTLVTPAPPTASPAAASSTAFDPARIYRQRSSGVVTIDGVFAGPTGAASQGSGFIVSTHGTILTSAYVVTDASSDSGLPVRAATTVYA